MKNQNSNKNTNPQPEKTACRTFPMKKSLAITLLSVGALVLSVTGIILSAYRLVKSGVNSFYECLQYPFLIAVCLFAIVVVAAVLIKCEYRVSGTELILCHGFLKTHIFLSQITAAVSDTDNDKIYLTLSDTEGNLVLSTMHDRRETLVRALLDGNPAIDYGFTMREKNEKDK